jgi:hypothetical protein
VSGQRRRLPNGCLLYCADIPAGSTEETLSVTFASLGLDITPERIEVRRASAQGRPHAIVSVPTAAIVNLLSKRVGDTWVLGLVQPLLKQERNTQEEGWPPRGVTAR